MKKILLGLFLTLGISVTTLANTINDITFNSQNDNSDLQLECEAIYFDCLISNTIEIYDGCGNFLASTNETYFSNDCGDMDGGVIMNVKRLRGNNCDNEKSTSLE